MPVFLLSPGLFVWFSHLLNHPPKNLLMAEPRLVAVSIVPSSSSSFCFDPFVPDAVLRGRESK
jgi:hypothetical protein